MKYFFSFQILFFNRLIGTLAVCSWAVCAVSTALRCEPMVLIIGALYTHLYLVLIIGALCTNLHLVLLMGALCTQIHSVLLAHGCTVHPPALGTAHAWVLCTCMTAQCKGHMYCMQLAEGLLSNVNAQKRACASAGVSSVLLLQH